MGYSWGEEDRGFDKRPNRIEGVVTGFSHNLATMRAHEVRPYVDPEPSAKVSIAFLARAPHKFTEAIMKEDVETRREALGSMSRWLTAHPKNKAMQVDAGAVPVLTHLLSDPNSGIREGASLVLSQLATMHTGIQAMLHAKTVAHLLKAMLDSESAKTRGNAHATLHLIGETPDGAHMMVMSGGTTTLVNECMERPSAEVLRSLGYCLRNPQGLKQALEAKANAAMVSCLANHSAPVVQHASKNISSLTIENAAKEEAIQEGAVKALVPLLAHAEWTIRSAASCALMSITIAAEGKRRAFDLGAIKALTVLLSDKNKSCVLYAVRTLGNLAELKREVLLTPHDDEYQATFFVPAMEQLKVLMGNSDKVLAKSARDTADLIKWRP